MKARTTQELDAQGGGKMPIGTVHEGPDVHFLLGIVGPDNKPVAEPMDDEAEASAAYWEGLRRKTREGLLKAAKHAVDVAELEKRQEEKARQAEFERQLLEGQ